VQPGDSLSRLADGSYLLRFAAPRAVASDLDAVVAVGAGFSTLIDPGDLPAGVLLIGEGGARRRLPSLGEPLPLSALEDWIGWMVAPVRALLPAPPAPPSTLYSLAARFGPPLQPATQIEGGDRSRLGDLLTALGGAALGLLLHRWIPRRAIDPLRRRLGFRPGPLLRGLGGLLEGLVGALALPFLGLGLAVGALWPRRLLAQAGRLWGMLGLGAAVFTLGSAAGAAILALWRGVGGEALAAALRQAVPLGGPSGGPARRWFFGLFPEGATMRAAREGLLRRLYAEAAERLEVEGDLERAAWVIAYLLGEKERAVAFLAERVGKEAAARLAEELHLGTAEVVEAWMAAELPEEALRVGLIRESAPTGKSGLLLRPLLIEGAAGVGDGERALRLDWPLADPVAALARAGAFAAGEGPVADFAFAAEVALAPIDVLHIEARIDRGEAARAQLAAAALRLGSPHGRLADPLLRALLVDAGGGSTAAGALARELAERGRISTLLRRDLPPFPGLSSGSPPGGAGPVELAWPPMAPRRAPGPAALFGEGLWVEVFDGMTHLAMPGQAPVPIGPAVDRIVPGAGLALLMRRTARGTALWALGGDGRLRGLSALPWDAVGVLGLPSLGPAGQWVCVGPDGPAFMVVRSGGLETLWQGAPLRVGRHPAVAHALSLEAGHLRILALAGSEWQRFSYLRAEGLRCHELRALRRGEPDANAVVGFRGFVIEGAREELRFVTAESRRPRRAGICLGEEGDVELRWTGEALELLRHNTTLSLPMPDQAHPPPVQRWGGAQVHVRNEAGRSVLVDLLRREVHALPGGARSPGAG